MLSSKVDTLLMFQPPTLEVLQQTDIHAIAKRYYDFFGFTDSALMFLKRYLTENFAFFKYFDRCSTMLNQGCRNFSTAWPNLHQDPSPLISVLFFQLENIESLADSLTPLEFKTEEQVREQFNTKIRSLKTSQQTIDKNFQTIWKQCHTQTTAYYQKLEEYKEQTDKVRRRYEKYEKQTRDFKSYNVTWVKQLEEKLNTKVANLKKTKEAYDHASAEAQESYQGVLNFFEANKGLIEDFLKLFLSTLVEMSTFMIERVQENFVNMRQTTLEILQKMKKLDVRGLWEAEDEFIRKSSHDEKQEFRYIKEMNRVNHHRQEFLTSVGSLSQDSMQICHELVEKFIYFEEVSTFETFFLQFDSKISTTLLPFEDFFKNLKDIFVNFFNTAKGNSEQIIQKVTHQRSGAYSSLVSALNKASNSPSMSPLEQKNPIHLGSPKSSLSSGRSLELVKSAVSDFLKIEENLAIELVKDLDRLYTSINTGIWNKGIQLTQKTLLSFQERVSEDNLRQEVRRIQANLVSGMDVFPNQKKSKLDKGGRPKIPDLNLSKALSQMEEDLAVADENIEFNSPGISQYNQNDFKFFKEKKAEVLAGLIKKQNEDKLKEINPNPYTVDFEKTKTSLEEKEESILGSYSCAFVDNMLLQGRMYITKTKIVFKSYFNGRTLFGQTLLLIPLEDIQLVAKKKNVIGLENMIEITTRKGELLFTSFVFRDKAFSIIDHVLKALNPEYTRSPRGRRSANSHAELDNIQIEDEIIVGESAEDKKRRKQQRKEMEFQRRNRIVLKAMPPLNQYEHLAYTFKYEVDYNVLTKALFSKAPIEHEGKTYSCCWEVVDEKLGSYNITIEDWNQTIPKNFSSKKELVGYKNCLERHCYGTRNLNMPVPLLPKTMTSDQTHRLFFVNEGQVALYLEMDSREKIPLSDAFKFHTCYLITNETKEDGKPMVSVSMKYYVEWFYDTMFKKIIMKTSTEEVAKGGPIFDGVIRGFISSGLLDKKKAEYAADHQEEEESEEEDEELNNHIGEEDQGLEADDKEEETTGHEKLELKEPAKKPINEFKVSKRVVFTYFAVTLISFCYIFLGNWVR